MKPSFSAPATGHDLSPAPRQEKVWDIVVRLFHWSLVACVAANLLLLEEGDPPHRWAGYIAVALVALRIIWGFVGSHHARFASFFPTPSRLKAHLAALQGGEHRPSVGHNPAGALMMLALLALIIGLGVSGYLMGTDRFWGEDWLKDIHEALATLLQLAVLLHVIGALWMSRVERVNLVHAMISGIKKWR